MFAREIGSYWILDKIGESRMGTVYKGIHRNVDQEVAVTLVKPEIVGPSGREAFLSRVELLKKLSHRAVVKVVDCLSDEEELFLLTELVPGETLAEKVGREGGLSVEAVREIFLPVLAGVAYMHGKKVVHGDLHADDILVGPDGVVQVAGFGMAAWYAPQEAQQKTADADLQAVGAVLAASLSGAQPGTGDADSCQQTPQEIQAAVQKVVEKANSADAEQRYKSAKEFARDLTAACGGGKWTPVPGFLHLAWPVLFLLVLLPLPFALLWHKSAEQGSVQHQKMPVPTQEQPRQVPKGPQPLPRLDVTTPPAAAAPAAETPEGSEGAAPGEGSGKRSSIAKKTAGGAVASASEKHRRKEHRKKKRVAKSHLRYAKTEVGPAAKTVPASVAVPAPIEKERWQIRK